MKKRVLSLLLMLVMVLTAVPFFAFSASAETVEDEETVFDYNSLYVINNRFAGKEYFDFGISVEDGGRYLNSGLIAYKERLGGRAIVYDTYTIDLKKPVI